MCVRGQPKLILLQCYGLDRNHRKKVKINFSLNFEYNKIVRAFLYTPSYNQTNNVWLYISTIILTNCQLQTMEVHSTESSDDLVKVCNFIHSSMNVNCILLTPAWMLIILQFNKQLYQTLLWMNKHTCLYNTIK